MENGKALCEIYGKRDSQEGSNRKKYYKSSRICPGYQDFPVRARQNQDRQKNQRQHKAGSPYLKPSKEQILYVCHMKPVLLIEEVLLLAFHRGYHGQFLLLADQIFHHMLRHLHDILHLHSKRIANRIFLILLLIKLILRIPINHQLEAGDQYRYNDKQHGRRCHQLLCFFHVLTPPPPFYHNRSCNSLPFDL